MVQQEMVKFIVDTFEYFRGERKNLELLKVVQIGE